MTDNNQYHLIKNRFAGYYPVVIDVETAGVNPLNDALLEMAAVLIESDEKDKLTPGELFACHVIPFENANIDPSALEVNKIDPYHPFRFAVEEKKALEDLYQFVAQAVKKHGCRRAVLVGHNAHFDLSFIQAANKRCKIKKMPFHAFTCFDTATLAGMVYSNTILARALHAAGISFNKSEAHSAIYDAKKTAELFCLIANKIGAVDNSPVR